MTAPLDDTHRADLVSWVDSAERADSDFPVQNLPLGCFRAAGRAPGPGIAIGDEILDLAAVTRAGLLSAELAPLIARCTQERSLNPLVAGGRATMARLRVEASRLLRTDTPQGARAHAERAHILMPVADVELLLPVRVGDYTDFYASIHHASNVGSMFRPDNALLPNYKYVPIGYHGRASSLVPSGAAVRRPAGQTREDSAAPPTMGPTRRLDYELEVGVVIGAGNPPGTPIPIAEAEEHVGGLCLVNDWSARDIQAWEYQPLGPFLAKNFLTTVSPWIVSLEALAPFRTPSYTRPPGDPPPLAYLSDAANERSGGFGITLEVLLSSARMRAEQHLAMRVSLGSFTAMYWTVAQLITHHASNGCNLQPGDLLASGTVSGETPESRGCLLERTWRGTQPLTLPTGETRRFLEDGDEVILRGWCEREGFRRIGFGECRGIVAPALPSP
ncbi:MAG TPA: fumarylacetoacetase [Gemmatimonadaceae bacterium]|nr:fumarylacetoacetase [Gemmatimonadaceae bacterium]